jgi:uncharacterized protein
MDGCPPNSSFRGQAVPFKEANPDGPCRASHDCFGIAAWMNFGTISDFVESTHRTSFSEKATPRAPGIRNRSAWDADRPSHHLEFGPASRLAAVGSLLGRRSLLRDSGVWIVPGNAIHTIGVMFSFDLVLIDKNFKVVGLRELVHPFTITRPNFRAESALQLPAHAIFCSRTQIGDQLLIERYEARGAFKGNGDVPTG